MTNKFDLTITIYEDKGIHWEELGEVNCFVKVDFETKEGFAEWLAARMIDLAQENEVELTIYDFEQDIARMEAFGIDATKTMMIELNIYGVMFELTKTEVE